MTPIPHNGCRPPKRRRRLKADLMRCSAFRRPWAMSPAPVGAPEGRRGTVVIQKNWQELIKPNKLQVEAGATIAYAAQRSWPNRSSAASA